MKILRNLTLFIVTVVMLGIAGCGSTTDQKLKQTDADAMDNGKLKLYWMAENAPASVSYFNKLLEEKGYDFQVEFITVSSVENSKEFVKQVQTFKEKQISVDILYAGSLWSNDYRQPYLDFVKSNMYLPLDDYLKTDKGMELWNTYEERIWERLKIDNSYYGISNNALHTWPPTILYRSDLAEKYSIDPEIFQKDISEWEKVLETVQVGENSKEFYAIACPTSLATFLDRYDYAVPYDLPDIGIVSNELTDNRNVENFFETESAQKLWDTIQDYMDKGYMPNTHSEDGTETYFCRDILFKTDSQAEQLSSEFGGGTWKAEQYAGNVYMNGANETTVQGIASWSKHPDEAFELLRAIMTDADLSNVLIWGEESATYTEINGRRQSLTSYPSDFAANNMLVEPLPTEPIEKMEVYPQLMKRGITPKLADFHFDGSEMKETIDRVEKVYEDMIREGIFLKPLDEINKRLKEAGISQIIDEYNRQLMQ